MVSAFAPPGGGLGKYTGQRQVREAKCTRIRTPARPSYAMTASSSGGEETGNPGQKESFKDWLYKKIMHNFDNESYGYEPFHKQAMNLREEEAKRAYDEAEQNKK